MTGQPRRPLTELTHQNRPRHCERSEAIHDFRPHELLRFARSDELNQPAPLLVLAWGNLSRGDDALGPLCLAALREPLPDTLQDQVEFLEDYQLQIEHALDLIGRKKVLFMDASLNCAAPFEVTELQPTQDASFTTHALSPQALLQVYQDMQGAPPPPCTLLAIRGEAFELGEPPSKAALANLEHARAWASQWLLKAS
jgi:hydrogenase maturation protease